MILYIIGNGFDLHHGLKTSYNDYKTFLNRSYPDIIREYEDFVGVYKNDRVAWSNIEDALKIDYLEMLRRYADLPSTLDEIYTISHEPGLLYYHNNLEHAFKGLTDFITDFTGKYLYDWLLSIDNDNVTPDLNLDQDDLYVTFNYLDSLERFYHIPDERILHIHGSLKRLGGLKKATAEAKLAYLQMFLPEVGKKEALEMWNLQGRPSFQNMYIRQELQFGAVINKKRELEKIKKWYQLDEEYADYVNPSIRVIQEFIEKSTKELSDNYEGLSRFVWTHNNIDTIVIMGHTLLGADYQYYKEIIVPFLKNRLWVFMAHNGNANEIMQFIERTGIANYRIDAW